MKNYTFCSPFGALFITFLLFLSSSVSAQTQAFTAGTNIVSAGLGFVGTASGANNVHSSSATPEYSLQYERGLWKAGPGLISLDKRALPWRNGPIGISGYGVLTISRV
jgi:hypothetical protein